MNYKDWTFAQWLTLIIVDLMALLGIIGAVMSHGIAPLGLAGGGILLAGAGYAFCQIDFSS